jgi:putative inorganic carbon (HCO3(-)) transporter
MTAPILPESTTQSTPRRAPTAGAHFGAHVLALEPLWLLLLTPLLLLPGRFVPPGNQWMIVLAALLFWPLRLLWQGRITPRTPIRLSVGLLLLCFPLAIWAAVDRPRAWEVAGYIMLGVAWANALVNWPRVQRHPIWIAWALILMGAGLSLLGPLILSETGGTPAVFAVLQRAAGPLARVLGETINANILAHALLVSLPLAAALALRGGWQQGAWQHRWLRALLALLVAWMLLVLYVTQSRGAYLAVAVMAPLLVTLRWPRFAWLAPLFVAGAIALFAWQGPQLLEALTAGSATSGIDERVEIWQRALYAMHDFSFTGLGLGNFDRVVPLLYPYLLIPPTVDIPDAHNLLLHIGADLGIPGLVFFIAFYLGLLIMAGGVIRHSPATPLRWALAAGSFTALVGVQVAGIFGAVNWGVKPTVMAWLLYALVVLLHRGAFDPMIED